MTRIYDKTRDFNLQSAHFFTADRAVLLKKNGPV